MKKRVSLIALLFPALFSFVGETAPAQEIRFEPAIVTADTHVEYDTVARRHRRRRHHRYRRHHTAALVGNSGAGGALV